MAASRIPGVTLRIWLARPRAMKPAPMKPTRIGLPSASLALSALSTMIIAASAHLCQLRPGLVEGHTAANLRLGLLEQRPRAILRRHVGRRQRPRDAEPRIVEAQPALGRRRVELADFVGGLGVVLENLVAVSEPLGHVEPAPVVRGQF